MMTTKTIYRVISHPAAAFKKRIAALVTELQSGGDFANIARTRDEAIAFVKDSPMDVIEPDLDVIFETPSFLKARSRALRAVAKDWFGQVDIDQIEIDDEAPVYDRERAVKRWVCDGGGCVSQPL